MSDTNSIVAIYDTYQDAEAGVWELQKGGFDMRNLSIVGREYHSEEHAVGYYSSSNRMKYWGRRGDFWGGLWAFMAGAAFFVLPGTGPILIAGPLAASIVATLEGATAVRGLSLLGAGLYDLGIPPNSILRYESSLDDDKILLLGTGCANDLLTAKGILRGTGPNEVDVHFAEQTVRRETVPCAR